MSPKPDSTLADPQRITDLERQLAEREAELAESKTERDASTVERDEALAREAATAEVLGVINSSPGNLVPVFDAVLEKAHTLCGMDKGALMIRDGEQFHAVVTRGLSEAYAEILRQPQDSPPGSPRHRLLNGERYVHVADLAALDLPIPRAAFELERARTVLFVPLWKDAALLGYITGYRQEVRPFTDKQIALLQNFAAQAVIAMENARLITETREALEQQTATAEVLQVINSSRGDPAPVFAAMLEKAASLCGATHGNLWTYDGERLHPAATHGSPRFADWIRQRGAFLPEPGSTNERIVQGENVIEIPDLARDPASKPDNRHRRALIEIGGFRTVLSVALRKEQTLLGVLHIFRQEVRPFTEKQIALLQNFAAQAVIAIENTRLITETSEALEHQTATAEVLGVINASPGDLGPVFDAMLEKAMRLCEASLGTLDRFDGEVFQSVALRGVSGAAAKLYWEAIVPDPGSASESLVRGEDVVHIPDVVDTEAYRSGVPSRRKLVEDTGARTALWVALRKEAKLLGRFVIYRKEVRPFTDKQIALVQNFAAQAVIAMENARLVGELRQRTDALTESLEYQTAISDVLKVISQSTFELQPVLKTVIETAMRLTGNDSGAIFLLKDASYRMAVQSGMTPTEIEISADYEHATGDDSLVGRTARDRAPVHILDSWTDPLYGLKDDAKRVSWRTMLGVPLLREGIPLGVICVARHHVAAFTGKQIELVRTFADQAVIAMENARLLGELRQRTEEVAELNRGLEARVSEQVEELGRVGRLRRFLAPQLAELIVSHGDEKILESHRREIVVVFCDLRGYTAFTETAEPEEVLEFLRQYHGALGPLVSQFEGTLDQFSGDGIMVFFNDPVPCPDPAERAVKMAMAMREAASTLIADWRERGRDLGFGVGIAQGYATLGQIGFSDRSGYTAIGTVCNVAARLCAEAQDGQILLSQRVNVTLKGSTATEQVGALALKGLTQPVVAYNVPLVSG